MLLDDKDCTGWTEAATGSSSTTVTATKAAESDKCHYICGISASSQSGTGAAETVTVKLIEDLAGDNTTLLQWTFIQGSTYSGYQVASDGGVNVTFPHPIKIGAGLSATLTTDPYSSGAWETNANLWGFTLKE